MEYKEDALTGSDKQFDARFFKKRQSGKKKGKRQGRQRKRRDFIVKGSLFAGLFFWAGLGRTQGQTPGLTYPVPIDEEHFPDAVFRNIVDGYDNDENGSLSVEECGNVTVLSINYSEDLTSLEGIRYFYALDTLDCGRNELTSLDVGGCTSLEVLFCTDNELTSLDVSGCTALASLNCHNNQLTSLDVGGLTSLSFLNCENNALSSLDVSGLTALGTLYCGNNQLTSLDLSGNPELRSLYPEDNRLDITLDANNSFDLAKASGWEGGTRLGNILTFNQREVTYAYATGYSGSTEDESLPSVRFSLRADREPGVANESMEAKLKGKVYAKEHVIHTEGIEGEISVFTPSGMLLYQGHGKEIPVRNDGLYIVRSGQQVWKVLVM